MKDFSDFVTSLPTEKYNALKEEILSSREPSSITDAVPDITFKMTMKLLELYHEWLHN